MGFDSWYQDYAKRYDERGLDDAPPVADMQAAWNAAVGACAKKAEDYLNLHYQAEVAGTARRIASDCRALSTAKAEADERCAAVWVRNDQQDWRVRCYRNSGHEGEHQYPDKPDPIAGRWTDSLLKAKAEAAKAE
jgi:hypothetical protein